METKLANAQANASEFKVAMRKIQAAILHMKTSTYSREEIHRLLRHHRVEPDLGASSVWQCIWEEPL